MSNQLSQQLKNVQSISKQPSQDQESEQEDNKPKVKNGLDKLAQLRAEMQRMPLNQLINERYWRRMLQDFDDALFEIHEARRLLKESKK